MFVVCGMFTIYYVTCIIGPWACHSAKFGLTESNNNAGACLYIWLQSVSLSSCTAQTSHCLVVLFQFLYISGVKITELSAWLIIFSKGGKAFIDTLLPRLNPRNLNGGPCMPFMIEVSLSLWSLFILNVSMPNLIFSSNVGLFQQHQALNGDY